MHNDRKSHSFPSVAGFLASIYHRLLFIKSMVKYGECLKSKLNIIVSTLLELIPRRLKQRLFKSLYDVLWKRIVIKVNDVRFIPVDFESICIVSPKHERWMWNYLKPKEGDVFIDVGAHIGKYALQVAKIVGEKGLVIAIEAFPRNYYTLLSNIKMNNFKNIIAFNIAAWEGDDKLKLFLGDVGGHHSVKLDLKRGFIEVQAKALDEILRKLNVKKVDWIKIDVEGAEYEALKGLKATLQQCKPRIIIESKKQNMEKLINFMRDLNYSINLIPESVDGEDVYFYFKPIKSN